VLLQDKPLQHCARSAARASTGWEQEDPPKHPARPAAWASTGWKQEDPTKHRALPAARASTGWKQEDPLKHRARGVPRTRPRLLRAVVEQTALAAQATVGTPAQEHAQRAEQASGNLLSAMVIARNVARASTGTPQAKPLRHPALPAVWGSTGWEQEDPVKHRARVVPRTQPRLLRAELEQIALATQATVGTRAQEHAPRA